MARIRTIKPARHQQEGGVPWENENGPRGAINTAEGLTHVSELAERG